MELLVMRAPPTLRFVLSARHDVRLGDPARRQLPVPVAQIPAVLGTDKHLGGRLVPPMLEL
jgi:hypothetical protein